MAKKLASWLRRAKVPARVRVLDVEGNTKTYEMPPPSDGRRFARAAADLEALSPTRLEAIDEQGNVLRVTEWEVAGAADAGELPTTNDPEYDRVYAMTRLIHEAADRGAQRHAEAYGQAFDRVCHLADLVSQRLQATELQAQRALVELGKLRSQGGAPEGPNVDEMIKGMLVSKVVGVDMAQVVRAADATNGKKKE